MNEGEGKSEVDQSMLYIYLYEDNIINSTKQCSKKGEGKRRQWEYNGGDELCQSALYMCIELPH
jgi:hypothetical protein